MDYVMPFLTRTSILKARELIKYSAKYSGSFSKRDEFWKLIKKVDKMSTCLT